MIMKLRRLNGNEPLNSLKNTKYEFAIEVDGIDVGVRTLTPLTGLVAKTGCEIFPEFRNNKYAEQSMKLMIQNAWYWGFETLITGVHESNIASQKVLFKNGFRVDVITKEPDGSEQYQVRLERHWDEEAQDMWFIS